MALDIKNTRLHLLLYKLWLNTDFIYRLKFTLIVLFSVLSSLSEAISIGAVIPFLAVLNNPDFIYENLYLKNLAATFEIGPDYSLISAITFFFIISTLISGLLRLTTFYLQSRLSEQVGLDLSIRIFQRTLYQSYAVHISRNSSEVVSGIFSKVNSIVGNTLMPVMVISSSIILVIFIVATLFVINPLVSLVAFIGFGFVYWAVILLSKRQLARDGAKVSAELNNVLRVLNEGLGGIREILVDGTQEIYCNLYRKADAVLRHSQANIGMIATMPRYLVETLSVVLLAILALFMKSSDSGISDALPTLGALAIGAQRLLPVMQQFYLNWSYLKGGQSNLKDALDLLDQPLPTYFNKPIGTIPFNNRIQLKNLSFSYGIDTPKVLNDINLDIMKGSKVGIVGETGGGKSTLVNIIMALLVPTEGSLIIDDIRIDQDNFRGWQLKIAHVPQKIFLADTSILENIAFGIPKELIDYELVKDAAKMAQLQRTIENLPDGYQTIVGEQGIRLSGGQKQRIGLARAFYKNCDVIILDEATSALDSKTEDMVMESIGKLRKDVTVIMIAHRLTTLRNCDHIVSMNKGSISKIQTYSELMKS
jgi:ABC-type multidrug transport system fused ATPase/permease subunit